MTYWNNLSEDIRILLVLAAYCLPFMLMTGVYTYRDAKCCGRNPIKWTLISLLGPCLFGFVIYLLTRDPNRVLECAICEAPVRTSDTVCAKCGTALRPVCPECANAVDTQWKLCPNCGVAVDAHIEVIAPVRRSSRMLWQILTAIILIPALLLGFFTVFMNLNGNNNLFLTRYDTQARLVDGFLDAVYYDTDVWYSFTRTNMDGSTVSVKQNFGFQVERTGTDGIVEVENWYSAAGGVSKHYYGEYEELHGQTYHELEGSLNNGETLAWGNYFTDEQGRLCLYQLTWGNSPSEHQYYHYRTELTYDDQGRIIKQLQENEECDEYFTLIELTPEESDLRYVTYTYDESGNVLRSEQYNYLDELVGYTEYTWAMDGTIRLAQSYNPDGTPIDYSVSRFDTQGRLEYQEFYNADGALSYTVEFDYDFVSYLLQPGTLMILIILWCVLMLVTVLMVLPQKKHRYLT